jgi:hypothetical protein
MGTCEDWCEGRVRYSAVVTSSRRDSGRAQPPSVVGRVLDCAPARGCEARHETQAFRLVLTIVEQSKLGIGNRPLYHRMGSDRWARQAASQSGNALRQNTLLRP